MTKMALVLASVLLLAGPARQPEGTDTGGTIQGRVIDGRSGRPLRRATVRLQAREGSAHYVRTTSNDGVYAFPDLDAGRYDLQAERGRFGVGGAAIELRAKEVVDRADLILRPGAVIAGRVLDAFGDPAPDVHVTAVRLYTDMYGYRTITPSGRAAITDDQGQYRLWGLRPGEYAVQASFSPPSPDPDESPQGVAPTYAPSATAVAGAMVLRLAGGDVAQGVDVGLFERHTATISGRVIGADGRPFTGRANVAHGSIRVYEQATRVFLSATPRELRPDGTFTVTGLGPGRYVVEVIGTTNADDDVVEIAQTAVSVSEADVTGIMMRAVRPSVVHGTIVVRDGSPASLNLRALKVFSDYVDHFVQVMPAEVSSNLTFTAFAYPGRNRLMLWNYGPPGWALHAVRVGGRDVTDGFDVAPAEDLRGVEVELTSRPIELSGRVVDDAGRAPSAPFVGVVVFPRDTEQWRPASPTRWVRASANGEFSLHALRPGGYLAIAVDDLDMGRVFDPEVLAVLAPAARSLNLAEGDHQTIELTVTGYAR